MILKPCTVKMRRKAVRLRPIAWSASVERVSREMSLVLNKARQANGVATELWRVKNRLDADIKRMRRQNEKEGRFRY